MKHLNCQSIIICILPLLALIFSDSAFPETTEKTMFIGDTSGSIVISTDDSIEIDNKRHIMTFTGNVEAVSEDLNIKCQKIEVSYQNPSDSNDPGKAQILEIIATGDVRVNRPDPDGGDEITATAEKAVYYQDDEKVVLTGNPVIKRGADSMEGTRITLFLKEERSVVEEGKAILFPNE